MSRSPVIAGTSLALLPDQFPLPPFDIPPEGARQTAVLAGGCFWCVEAVYVEVAGVLDVTSGYAGGSQETANYRAVSTGATDHAEAVRIVYDPRQISYGEILRLFFSVAHDPTELDRQGNDVGRQYRSAIFYTREEERDVAAAYIAHLNEIGAFVKPIVTTLEPLDQFFEAEAYHHRYAARNPGQPYIAYVSQPKVEKLRRYRSDRLRNDPAGER